MSPDGNPPARLEPASQRLPFGSSTNASQPAERAQSISETPSLSQGPAASLGELLARAIASIHDPSQAQQRLLDKLHELGTRFAEGRLRVAVIGQFKRGKSTLLNALLGAAVLPTGVTPVTAIATFIEASESTWVRIAFNGGKAPIVTDAADDIRAALERHISEAQNPHNRLDVESVTLGMRSRFLEEGIVLVDTPGVGSTFVHNTRAAETALIECDVALFVLSADPPITETEANYLDKVRALIPKVFFVLNKVDLLDDAESDAAARFLAGVLAERFRAGPPDRIFSLSAKQALRARLANDAGALASSGLASLEAVLGGELAREKRAILLATGRQRLFALVSDLLLQSELEWKALATPEEDLKRKAATFETSAADFESERQRLADLLSLDRKRLLRELDAETDRVWFEARSQLQEVVADIVDPSVEERSARERIAGDLARHFERALGESVRSFQAKLEQRVAPHRRRAGDLVNLVRQMAADLMEISVRLPQPEEAFQPKREPYWVAPAPTTSLLDLSAGAAERLLPRALRVKRARARLLADAEKAALRNVANLDWAMRQNIEDSFRRFETSLSDQLALALAATRQAMQLALQRRAARSEAVKLDIERAGRVVAALAGVLSELEASEAGPDEAGRRESGSPC